ncbi:hypothetical protein ScPMuIL_015467 [Solemya velum]
MTSLDKFATQLPSGQVMPAVGLGTYAPKQEDDEVINAVKTAVKLGYRHLDCAALYRNERAIGHAIKQLIIEDNVKRQDLFISSKLWNTCHRADLVRPSLKKSLEDLGVKYIDLYLMHWPFSYKEGGRFYPTDEEGGLEVSDIDYMDTWRAMEDCVDEGLVKNLGASNFSVDQLKRVVNEARIKPVNHQIEVYLHYANTELVEFCKSKNVSVTAYCPLGSPWRFNAENLSHPMALEEPVVKDIAASKNKTPAQILLRFLLQRGVSVIPKSSNPVHIAENIQLEFQLSDSEMSKLLALNKDYKLIVGHKSVRQHKYFPIYRITQFKVVNPIT